MKNTANAAKTTSAIVYFVFFPFLLSGSCGDSSFNRLILLSTIFLATGLELSDIISDLSLMARSALGDPTATAQLQKAMATWNPSLGVTSFSNELTDDIHPHQIRFTQENIGNSGSGYSVQGNIKLRFSELLWGLATKANNS